VFYPLWPWLLGLLHTLLLKAVSVPVLGMLVSGVLFVLIASFVWRSRARLPDGFAPRSELGFAALVFSPGAYSFFSNHSESLFLALSFFSLLLAHEGKWRLAAILAGLCALCRNQGILVAASCALMAFSGGASKGSFVRFGISGLISACVFGSWPLFQYLVAGKPYLAWGQQLHWQPIYSLTHYVRNLMHLSPTTFIRTAITWGLILQGIWLARRAGGARFLGVYLILSALVLPYQGYNKPNAVRYSAVLFPFWFYLGDWFAGITHRLGDPWRGVMRSGAGIALVFLSLYFSRQFYLEHWAY
jgi:hypothetical protein